MGSNEAIRKFFLCIPWTFIGIGFACLLLHVFFLTTFIVLSILAGFSILAYFLITNFYLHSLIKRNDHQYNKKRLHGIIHFNRLRLLFALIALGCFISALFIPSIVFEIAGFALLIIGLIIQTIVFSSLENELEDISLPCALLSIFLLCIPMTVLILFEIITIPFGAVAFGTLSILILAILSLLSPDMNNPYELAANPLLLPARKTMVRSNTIQHEDENIYVNHVYTNGYQPEESSEDFEREIKTTKRKVKQKMKKLESQQKSMNEEIEAIQKEIDNGQIDSKDDSSDETDNGETIS